jgi:CheY-like chemotaxis protein/signal transduction histidine kinase
MKRKLDVTWNRRVISLCVIAFVVFAMASIHGYAQDTGESLRKNESREKIDLIIQQTSALAGRQPQEVLLLVREGLRLCQDTESSYSKLILLQNGSSIAEMAGDLKLSEKFLELALVLAQHLNDRAQRAVILGKHGELLAHHFQYESGIKFLVSAYQLYEELGETKPMIDMARKIAVYSAMHGNGNQAKTYAALAFSAASVKNDPVCIAGAYQTKGVIQLILENAYRYGIADYVNLCIQSLHENGTEAIPRPSNSDTAPEALENAITHYEQSGDSVGRAECYQLKGDIARTSGHPEIALDFYQKADELYASSKDHPSYITLLIALSVTEALQDEFNEAGKTIDTAITYMGNPVDVPWLYLLKAEISMRGDNDPEAEKAVEEGIRRAYLLNNPVQLNALYRLFSRLQMNLGEYNKSIASLDLANTYALKISEASAEQRINEQKNRIRDLEQSRQIHSSDRFQQLKSKLAVYSSCFKTSWILGLILLVLCITLLAVRIKSQKRAERKLQLTKEEVSELKSLLNESINEQHAILKNLAQEMRTPMSGIVGAIPLLHDTSMSPLQENCVNIIDVSSRAILSLINDISDLSRLDSGEFKLAHNPLDLVHLTQSIIQLFVSDSEQTGVELICDVPSDPIPMVKGDANRIQQILLTLVGRSFQTTFKGHVAVKLEPMIPRSDREFDIRIIVEDSGTGIEEKAIEKIFEISPSLTNINSLRRPASMLGMAICKKLVEAMRGSIEIKSQRHGGLKVVVMLPFMLDPGETSWNVLNPYERFPKNGALIINHSKIAQRLIAKHLRAWGVVVETVPDMEKAEPLLKKNPGFDVIILDTDSTDPDSGTLEKITLIRQSEESAETPIILLVPQSKSRLSQELKHQKYIHVLPKPIQVEDLHSRIHQAIVYKSPLTQSFATLTLESRSTDTSTESSQMDPNTGFHFIPYILPFRSDTKIDENLKILLAEDNAVNQKVTSLMLKKIGYHIDIVANGKEAIQAVKRGNYDVVLMDKTMPLMDGLEAALNIRKLMEIDQPIIIALTASASMEDEIACRKATMDNFLAKPVQFEKMKAALAFASGVLEQRRQAGTKP